MLMFVGMNGISAESMNKDVELTDEQKQEMQQLQQESLEYEKSIIDKYVEYGVFSQEKAEKIKNHLEERYAKLEENGFVPKWDKKHHKNTWGDDNDGDKHDDSDDKDDDDNIND